MKNLYIIVSIFLLNLPGLPAQDGSLDITFGNNGIVQETFGESTRFETVALQEDGKIVVAGARGLELMVARFLADGSPDVDFGENGFYYNDLGTAATAYKVLIQPDGKIIALGTHRESGSKFALLAIRLLSDGSGEDTDFGNNGTYSNLISGSSFAEDDILDAVLLSDGKIAIAGRSYSGQRDIVVTGRITADGQPDMTYGDNGITLLDFNSFSRANGLVVTDNGNLVVTGTTNSSDIFIAAYQPDGTLQLDFGVDGVTTFNEGSGINNGANDLVLLPDGKFLVGGNAFDFGQVDNDISLYRFLNNGMIDPGFGDEGIVKIARSGNEAIQSLVLQPNGQILTGGGTGGFNPDFALSRFSQNGVQDMEFGEDGWSITSVAPGTEADGITSIAQYPDGSIVAAGFTLDGETYSYALAKFKSTITNTVDLQSTKYTVRLFPTIINDQTINLTLTTENPTDITLKVFDTNGKMMEMLKEKASIQSGTHQLTFLLKNQLPKGTFFLQITSKKDQKTIPFFIH